MPGTSQTVRTRLSNSRRALTGCWTCRAPMGFQSLCRLHISLTQIRSFRKPSMAWIPTLRSTSPSSTSSPTLVWLMQEKFWIDTDRNGTDPHFVGMSLQAHKRIQVSVPVAKSKYFQDLQNLDDPANRVCFIFYPFRL